ncbi:glycosyltransferase family A protein [Pseudoalteromonas carrageenovora]|nr:glycosyltransferase family A protein [Pseudoalteromonas carrageenovora]MDO6637932.1 glycosyltransferase family A protein [Pseudoalteromonas carrageenovora]MDO6650231.1 glycosyltransferase family A protein [Pseudoalteromonas carrageenovora]
MLRKLTVIKKCGFNYKNAPVIIGINLCNQAEFIAQALHSALSQSLVENHTAQIVILDDQSTDNWQTCCQTLIAHPCVTVLSAFCGSPARARNQLLDYASTTSAHWVARLDADDILDNAKSVESLWLRGEASNADFVVGSNRLKQDGQLLSVTNIAKPEVLLNPIKLTGFIKAFCHGLSENELPSCNLLLNTRVVERYPNILSAEDHWLIARLLLLPEYKGEIVSLPYYSVYTLDGIDTTNNKKKAIWTEQRQRLAVAAKQWMQAQQLPFKYLGSGQEGVVIQKGNKIEKSFYPWAINDDHVSWLKQALPNNNIVPQVSWHKHNEKWSYTTPNLYTSEIQLPISAIVVGRFLQGMYAAGICGLNIKRDNIRQMKDGSLHYIDVGTDIQPLTASKFVDMSARLYAIALLQLPDEELVRRTSSTSQDKSLQQLRGFADFYLALIEALHPHVGLSVLNAPTDIDFGIHQDTTLLIKACAQDADVLFAQVDHIVTQLNYPKKFKQIVLLLDSYQGPFLRQYQQGDLNQLLTSANELVNNGIIDELLIAPTSIEAISATYRQWFGASKVTQSHTTSQAPLFSQIWAFNQVTTRYVFQCDCDVLVGRKDWQHDYIADMKAELIDPKVISVGFNIPKSTDAFVPYFGQDGQFAPEVRMGLLDLIKIKQALPINNPIINDKYTLTWHRALQAHQKVAGLSSLRGGDPATFYIHPRNEDKQAATLNQIRDLVAQGFFPVEQEEQFDLMTHANWQYPRRKEAVIFLLKGRFTAINKLERCLDSLRMQSNQSFGIVLIDDASGASHNWCYPILLDKLLTRTTLIRHQSIQGRVCNFIQAISDVCINDESIIVILDQDDCLMRRDVVKHLLDAANQGADLIHMPMFRPNKPLKLYQPSYSNIRQKGGGNVWAHQRAFKKSLFESVPHSYFKKDQDWIPSVTDYATMLPMAEVAKAPVFIDIGYSYFHQRAEYSLDVKAEQGRLLEAIFAKGPLSIEQQ